MYSFFFIVPILIRSEEHTSELQSHCNIVCRLLFEKTSRRPHASTRSTTAGPGWGAGLTRIASATMSARAESVGAKRTASRVSATVSLFLFNDTAAAEIYTFSLHDALPI